MSGSPPRPEADRRLRVLMRALTPAGIQERIGVPLEKAAGSYNAGPRTGSDPIQPEDIRREAGRFLQHLYAHGVTPPRRISAIQAEAEALALLESGYQGMGGRGLDAAIEDALSMPEEGMDIIHSALLEAVKQRSRQAYIQYLFHLFCDPTDWPLQIAMTQAFLEMAADCLPEAVAHGPAARFARQLPQLILNYIDAQSELHHLIRPH